MMRDYEKLNIQEEKVKRREPRFMYLTDDFLFAAEYEKYLPKCQATNLECATLLENGTLFAGYKPFNLLPESESRLKFFIKSCLRGIKSIHRAKSLGELKNTIFVTNHNSKNFFHWFFDVLPKLEFLENFDFIGSHSIIIPSAYTNLYNLETLKNFNLNIVFQENYCQLQLKNLIVMPDIAPTGNYREEIVQKLRRRMRSGFSHLKSLSNQQAKKKVYITRSSAPRRKIVNEASILPFLIEQNFTIVDMDLITFDQQVSVMMDANFLISLHGAGLTHMIWMSEGASVMEVRARGDSTNNCYYSLASAFKFDYFYTIADKIDKSDSTQSANFFIDVHEFKVSLQRMLNNQN